MERADQIIVLEAGRIVESGTHADLLAAGGIYSRLLDANRSVWSIQSPPAPSGSGSPVAYPRAGIPGAMLVEMRNTWPVREPAIRVVPGPKVLGRLLGFLDGSWRDVALSVMLATLTIGSSVALMGTSAWLISAAALHPGIAALQVAIVGVRLFGISRAVFRYFERLVSHGVTFRLLRNIRVWFYEHLEPLAPARLMDYRAGDLVNRAVADVETLENLYVRVLSPVMTAIVLGAVVSAFLWSQGASELAAVLAAGFILAGLVVPIAVHAERSCARIAADRAPQRPQIADGGRSPGLGRSSGFRKSCGSIGQHLPNERSIRRGAAGHGTHRRSPGGAFVGCHQPHHVVLADPLDPQGRPGHGQRVASRSVRSHRCCSHSKPLPRCRKRGNCGRRRLPRHDGCWRSSPSSRLSRKRRQRPPRASTPNPANDPSGPVLEFRRVGFQYPGRSRPALRDVTFAILRGECVAVVGPSGAGKSTLAQLLLRFWEYGAGEILLRGQSLRSHVSG